MQRRTIYQCRDRGFNEVRRAANSAVESGGAEREASMLFYLCLSFLFLKRGGNGLEWQRGAGTKACEARYMCA